MNEYIGILEDTRPDEEKVKDFQFEEIASAVEPIWEEREPKKYPIFNQDGSSSCVANACAKILGIDEIVEGREFINLSRRDIYVRRTNQGGGMYLPEALRICKEHGATYESLVTSENKNEVQMNSREGINSSTDIIALKYRSKGYVELPIDIDTIATILNQGKGVLFGFGFDYDEWTDFPTVHTHSTNKVRHGVTGVDAILKDGKKYIVIDDSWSPSHGVGGQRYISEEFLKAKCFYAGYTMNLVFEPEVIIVKNNFTELMRFGCRSEQVKLLQCYLKKLGLFPQINCTGYFGSITKRAVISFQKLHELKPDGIVGAITRSVLNK